MTEDNDTQFEAKITQELRELRSIRPSPVILERVLAEIHRPSIFSAWQFRGTVALSALALLLFVTAGTQSGFTANREINDVLFATEVEAKEIEAAMDEADIVSAEADLIAMDFALSDL